MVKIFLVPLALLAPLCFAHEGPPYPLFVNRPTAHGLVSVWTDPDVGEGTFIVLLENEQKLTDDILKVKINTRSKKNLEPFKDYPANRDAEYERQSGKYAFVGKIPFDHEGMWEVGFTLANEPEILVDVEVTPPGPSRMEFLIYCLPFVCLGALWLKTVFSKRKAA